MNDYERKQERRRQRLAKRAEHKDAEAQAARRRSDEILQHIPPGQPILVGHHSEKRHRRDLARGDRAMRKSLEAAQQAEELRGRAAAVGTGGISSDDPEALAKLQAQLDQAQVTHQRMVAANRLLRKGDHASLLALGFSEPQIAGIIESGGPIYAPYQIANSSANLRRLKARVAGLPRRAEQEAAFEEIAGDGWRIYAEENRLCIVFAERTSKERYNKLRSHGFIWSPTRRAFVRKFSNQAVHWAKQIVGALT